LGDFVEAIRLARHDTGAMRRHADLRVLLEDDDIQPFFRHAEGRVEPGGAGTHHDDVACHLIRLAWSLVAQAATLCSRSLRTYSMKKTSMRLANRPSTP